MNLSTANAFNLVEAEIFLNPISHVQNEICDITKAAEEDGIDNDCDGAIDEEICCGQGKITMFTHLLFADLYNKSIHNLL